MLKRTFHKMLSEGEGRQLLWLFITCIVTAGRTVITFIDGDMRRKMDDFVANNQDLFDLSHYRYVSPTESEDHKPNEQYGDFLDVEWEFMDSQLSSPFVRQQLQEWACDPKLKLIIALTYDDAATNAAAALHLPHEIYKSDTNIAVYQKEHTELIDKAIATGRYGHLVCFGEAIAANDALFIHRAERGKRVNFVYNQKYGEDNKAANADEAWIKISHAHKQSSIASANSIPLKLRAFDLKAKRADIDAMSDEMLNMLSEVEHRRWMISMLFMGYQAASIEERKEKRKDKKCSTN